MENLKVLFPVHIREKIKDGGWTDLKKFVSG